MVGLLVQFAAGVARMTAEVSFACGYCHSPLAEPVPSKGVLVRIPASEGGFESVNMERESIEDGFAAEGGTYPGILEGGR